ncbi:MAG: lysophospholipid acyltransferase family protein, partial [Lysobacterales bacterium]
MITLLKSILWLLSRLSQAGPWRLAQRWAPLWMRLSPGKRRVASANLEACLPALDAAARERLVRESFVHYLCSILETGRNRYWPLERLHALCDGAAGVATFTTALAAGKGVVVLAPHFGAWEYLGMYLQKFPDIAILYKPPGHPALEKALQQQRSRGGANMLPATAAGLRQLYTRVLAGKGVGLLPDQQP